MIRKQSLKKALLLGLGLAFAFPVRGWARTRHRVVFDVAVANPEAWKTALRNVANLRKALGAQDTQVEVVAYSKGLGLLLLTDKELSAQIATLADGGVAFEACDNSLHARHEGPQDLLPKAKVVDSGVAEIVRREEQGWSYIKVVADAPEAP